MRTIREKKLYYTSLSKFAAHHHVNYSFQCYLLLTLTYGLLTTAYTLQDVGLNHLHIYTRPYFVILTLVYICGPLEQR